MRFKVASIASIGLLLLSVFAPCAKADEVPDRLVRDLEFHAQASVGFPACCVKTTHLVHLSECQLHVGTVFTGQLALGSRTASRCSVATKFTSPSHVDQNFVNRVFSHTIAGNEFGHSRICVGRTNLGNLLRCQSNVRRSFTESRSVLCSTITSVVGKRSEEQVDGIAARRVVAFVQHVEPRGNRPILKFKGDTVNEERNLSLADPAVAFSISTASPLPAVLFLHNASPKTLAESAGLVSHNSNITACCQQVED